MLYLAVGVVVVVVLVILASAIALSGQLSDEEQAQERMRREIDDE